MCFLISDFQAEGFEKQLRILSKKHDLTCCITSDPGERELPPCGIIELTDPETGELFVVDSGSAQLQTSLRTLSSSDNQELISLFRRNRAGFFHVETQMSVADQVLRYLKERERRAGR